MPKRTDINTVLIIGAGPIIIGQACEFDYSGTQACKALKEEGYRVVLVNSNPATIMTDPEFADRTYIEPITPECVEKIILREREAIEQSGAEGKLVLLPTLGGQTALNTAMSLHRSGVLERLGIEMIGANAGAIERGEDRQLFKDAMIRSGLDVPASGVAHTLEEAMSIADEIRKFPLIIRPAYTLGGTGGGIAYNRDEFEEMIRHGLDLSPVTEVLVEESLLGWKEFEMEVMRDRADNCVIICSIENFDPMGVHTGDSITVAPTLNTQMKSVGEAMAIGRTFKESLQKALRSLEVGRSGLGGDGKPWRIGNEVYGDRDILPREVITQKLSVPNAERVFFLRHALRAGFTIDEIFDLTKIDRWFLTQIKEIVDFEEELAKSA